MFRFQLSKGNSNYCFFCPETKLNLNLSNPIGSADRVSIAISNGIKLGYIIDLDNAENSIVKDIKAEEVEKEIKLDENDKIDDIKAEEVEKEIKLDENDKIDDIIEEEVAITEEDSTPKRKRKNTKKEESN